MPASIASDAVCVEDALQGLGVRAVGWALDEVAVLGALRTVCCVFVVGIVVGEITGVVPADGWADISGEGLQRMKVLHVGPSPVTVVLYSQ